VPVGHPLDRTDLRLAALDGADVVLLADVRDPGLVAGAGRRRTLVDVAAAPLRNAAWMVADSGAGSPLRLAGDPGATLEALAAAVKPKGRRPWLPPQEEPEASVPGVPPDAAPLDKVAIASIAAHAAGDRDAVVVHGSLGGAARRAFRFRHPSRYVGRSGGEGLGYALPASLGAALALQGTGRLPIGFETDGDSLYLPQALWTAAHERIGILLVVENNRGYWRDEIHQRAIAGERGRDEERAAAGVHIRRPDVDFATLARSLGVEATGPVTTAGELRRALATGVRAVEDGRPFLVDVRTA
jgi:benzoylformate decarboxylase/acetolactate synthase-1/2/3 large subunit